MAFLFNLIILHESAGQGGNVRQACEGLFAALMIPEGGTCRTISTPHELSSDGITSFSGDPTQEALQHMNDHSGLTYFPSTAFESKLSTRCRQNK